MAEAVKSTELDDVALTIFAQRIAHASPKRGIEGVALDCYRAAESFLAIKGKVQGGALKVEKKPGPRLAEFDAPNLPFSHPHRLVASKGNAEEDARKLEKVRRISDWLDRNPTPEGNPQDLIERLNQQFPELGWDLATTNIARAIFPTYCPKKAA